LNEAKSSQDDIPLIGKWVALQSPSDNTMAKVTEGIKFTTIYVDDSEGGKNFYIASINQSII
jgi:hypothetical protein